ncbi:WD40-like Beta Propeller Repeat [Nocardioides alpinus]|uniref:WD40-like Beta Propeller Repeat n=1 Tax=Nocardioides alpinus TaxID=748909 RepID=A0A1I0ZRZ3_9ACTN|nr:PD40 domain-containing protein [Nocardioides alpinus]PKH41909.1 hypothetical protein CXG46_08635 [Nocardioides alpinus]SFB27210.1 WD40-like Beta Propeller Repeat [Nocardioides alpinus]
MTPFSCPSTGRTYALTTAAAVIALAGCSSPEVDRADPAAASPQPRVLFQADGPDHILIAVGDLDGSETSYPLADLPGGHQMNPDWSPDGSQIVFAVNDGTRDDLWVSGADGSAPHLLLDCAGACRYLDDPSWSPDGASIVYSRTVARGRTGHGSLEEVDVATGEVSVILAPRVRTFTAGARWSPDGSRIVFESVHKAGPGVEAEVDGVSLRIADREARRAGPALTEPDLFAATADWSPDGTTIVYSALAQPDAGNPDLFVIPAAGGEPRQVTTLADAGGYAVEPTWRADSTRIVFSGKLPGAFEEGVLLTVSADGSAVEELGASTIVGRHPRVEPGA